LGLPILSQILRPETNIQENRAGSRLRRTSDAWLFAIFRTAVSFVTASQRIGDFLKESAVSSNYQPSFTL
jgi:hypothetical protein